MLLLMIALGVCGIALLIAAPLLARLLRGGRGDTVGLTRVLQLVGIALVLAALFARPYNPDTAAIPPPPDGPEARPR